MRYNWLYTITEKTSVISKFSKFYVHFFIKITTYQQVNPLELIISSLHSLYYWNATQKCHGYRIIKF